MGDIRTTTGESTPLTAQESHKKGMRYLLIGSSAFLVILLAGFLIPVQRYAVASGYVTSREYAEVHPPVTGTVAQILVKSGDTVKEGQLLVQLNSEEEEATLAEAKARHSKLETELQRRQAEMDIDLDRRTVDLTERKRNHADAIVVAKLQLENATTKRKLTQDLVDRGLKAAMNLQDEKLHEELARVTLQTLLQKDFTIHEELLKRDREKYAREIAALKKELSALADAVRRAEARLRTRQVRAPIAGQVVRYEFVVGELLQPGNVIYEIFGGEINTLKIRVPERFATKVQVGQSYRAELNTLQGLKQIYFRGKIQYLRNVIQGEGNDTWRTAYCSFDKGKYHVPPGTTAEARIYYGKSPFWFFLLNTDL